jgi:hypothetical protein
MNTRGIILILLLQITFHTAVSSQELNINLESGLGSYKMGDLKELNDMVLESLPFDSKITENFPNYFYYKPSLNLSLNKIISFGIVLSYQSTGSRISRADYSGEYFYDTKIRALSPGILIEFYRPIDKFRVSFSSEFGINYSKLYLKEYLRVYSETDDNDASFVSHNFYYEPAFKISYSVGILRVGMTAGYLVDFSKGKFADTERKVDILTLTDNSQPTADWQGMRLGIAVSTNILKNPLGKRQPKKPKF